MVVGTAPARAETSKQPTRVRSYDFVVEGLLRQLIGRIIQDAASHNFRTEQGGVEVLCELTTESGCYVLTRHPDPAGSAALIGFSERVMLSPREKEIVRLVAKGLPNKAIAAVLDISYWTIGTHIRRIFAKLGVSSRAEMVAHAMREGLLQTSL